AGRGSGGGVSQAVVREAAAGHSRDRGRLVERHGKRRARGGRIVIVVAGARARDGARAGCVVHGYSGSRHGAAVGGAGAESVGAGSAAAGRGGRARGAVGDVARTGNAHGSLIRFEQRHVERRAGRRRVVVVVAAARGREGARAGCVVH